MHDRLSQFHYKQKKRYCGVCSFITPDSLSFTHSLIDVGIDISLWIGSIAAVGRSGPFSRC